MKISNTEERVRILNSQSSVWSVIREITSSEFQEDAFYVCDIGEIVRKHDIWKTELPRVKPFYAVKCNDGLPILEVLSELGTGFDCASKAEINKVLDLGVEPDRIIFANPAKVASHIRYASDVSVSTMTFDNEMELIKVKKYFPDARMVIRIRCDAADARCQLGMKFGCDPITEAPNLLRLARSLDINVVGVSFHVGSDCREVNVFNRAIAAAYDVFNFAKTLGFDFKLLDIGGGYPGNQDELFKEIASTINLALDTFFPDPSIEVIAEPGRFYVSSAYTLACNIHSVRNDTISSTESVNDPNNIHRRYYINDGVYGSFNCILYDHQDVYPQPLIDYPGCTYYSSSIWGPTCDGLDVVVKDVMLPDMKLGDWIIFENMGAYTLPVASQFNGFPIPKVHIVVDENIWLQIEGMLSISDKNFEIITRSPNLRMAMDIGTMVTIRLRQ